MTSRTKKRTRTIEPGIHCPPFFPPMTSEPKESKSWVDLSILGLMFPTSIAVGVAIGYFLDRWLHTAPYLLIIFTLYGVVAGFYHLFRITRQDEKK